MEGRDIAVSLKVRNIEGKNAIYRIEIHQCNKARIKNFDSVDIVMSYDPFPLRVNTRNIGQQSQHYLDGADFLEHLLLCHAKAIGACGTRCDVPEFRDVLRTEEKRLPLA